jgi:hypothetical protein
MKISKSSLVLTAAFAGLLGGTMTRVNAMTTTNSGSNRTSSRAVAGQLASSIVQDDSTDKHACKGKNSCKGKGGCSTGDNGCKGKNSCKGKGGCATDGSKG